MFNLMQGDCLDLLKTLPDNSIDSIVTDPPYGINFMQATWDKGVPGVDVWAECLRVLKPGGYLLAFAGTRTQHRMAVNIEDAGFEIKDMIAWVYGSGWPKGQNIEKALTKKATSDIAKGWEGWNTQLKPALEPITMARKPHKGSIVNNVLANGVGGINVDACRVATDEQLSAGAGGLLSNVRDGKAYPEDNGFQQNPGGRYPANLIHDGSEEVVSQFPANAGASAPVKGTEPSNTTGNVYGQMNRSKGQFHNDKGSAARFFYCAKASKSDRNEGLPEDMANKHPTVKPTDLMRYLCRLVTPAGGVILDPFMGSGSTGKAAIMEGFLFTGIELEPESFEVARLRVSAAQEASC